MSNENFNLSEVLNEMESKAEKNSAPTESKVSLSQLNQVPAAEEKRKLFQNKKANIAIGVVFGLIVVAFAAFLIVPSFL